MSKTRHASKAVLPLPTTREIAARADELRAAMNLDDDATIGLIRGGLAHFRQQAIESFEVDYLVGCGSMVHYMLEMI